MSSVTATAEKKRALSYEKGLSRPKDSNAPKRPLTAFFQWAAENRDRVQEECGSSNVAEVTKKLGEMWRSLPAGEKTGWEDKVKSEMDTYKDEMSTYKATNDYENFAQSLCEYNIKMTYKPFKKDDNMPKRPLSAYMLFSGDERPKVMENNQSAKITEVMKLVAEAWKGLSDSKKAPYLEKAKELSEGHAKLMETYNKSAERVKAYKKRMVAKRFRLMKQAGMLEDAEKGSGATPGKKRAKKKSEPKKKKSSAKKASGKKKVSKAKKKSAPKKKSLAKISSAKKKSSTKKKVSKPKKKSAAKKAKKAKAANTNSKK